VIENIFIYTLSLIGLFTCLSAGLAASTWLLTCAANSFWRKLQDVYTLSLVWKAVRMVARQQDEKKPAQG
jgi:ABC-type transporter Mla maintaining outer membrane lipid asymmetry permease subunit MlaE